MRVDTKSTRLPVGTVHAAQRHRVSVLSTRIAPNEYHNVIEMAHGATGGLVSLREKSQGRRVKREGTPPPFHRRKDRAKGKTGCSEALESEEQGACKPAEIYALVKARLIPSAGSAETVVSGGEPLLRRERHPAAASALYPPARPPFRELAAHAAAVPQDFSGVGIS